MTNYLQQVLPSPDQTWVLSVYHLTVCSFTRNSKLTISIICFSALFRDAIGNGDQSEQDCGSPGARCTFVMNCTTMTLAGWGPAYWILFALQNFQSNLNYASMAIQAAVLNDTLAINSLVSDFSTPSQYQVASGIKAYISASLFIAGGAAGSTAILSRDAAAARASMLGPAKAALNDAKAADPVVEADVQAAQAQVTAIEAAIAKNAAGKVKKTAQVSGALICK